MWAGAAEKYFFFSACSLQFAEAGSATTLP
jgi:hypothetical protein